MKDLNYYFIAVARHARNSLPGNWVEMIAAIEGVLIVHQGEFMAKIQSTPDGVEQIRRLFGDALMIEETIERRLL
jgi:hypothetical protein